LVEPSADLAKNLKVLLSTLKDFRVVGQSSCGLDAMRMMSTLSPDVLVLDLSLPDMTAMDIALWTQKLFPKTSLVLLSTYDLPEYRAAAGRLKNTLLVNKADLWRKMPQALMRLRREQVSRERERGTLLLQGLHREFRNLTDWFDSNTRARNQEPLWRFIHLGIVLLSIEIILGLSLGHGMAPQMMVAGWAMILAALIRDFGTLRADAASKAWCILGQKTGA